MTLYSNIKKKIIGFDDLKNIRKKYPDEKIVFCVGCFDIVHIGHAVFFNQAKSLGDILIVGLGRDSTVQLLKGPQRPVNPQMNRLGLVAAFQDIDFCLLNENTTKKNKKEEYLKTKIDFKNIIKELKPDIFVSTENSVSLDQKKELCQKLGIEFKLVPRNLPDFAQPFSTTKIINRVKDIIKK